MATQDQEMPDVRKHSMPRSASSAKTPSEADRELGALIRHARVRCKMSQTALAREIGVSYQQFQKYETGANRITVLRLMQIARALSVSMSTFFEDGGAPVRDLGVKALVSDPAGRMIIDAWLELEKGVRDRIGRLVAELAESKHRNRRLSPPAD